VLAMFFSFFCISITSGEGFADFIFIYFFASHRVSTSKELKRYPSMRTMGSNSLGNFRIKEESNGSGYLKKL
jgi:hypothetical protein